MREILFRGKRADNGGWVVGNLFVPDKRDTPTQICVGTNVVRITYDVLPETVGQYTGLTDKNGKRVFEGDIVKFYDTIHKVVFETRNGTAYFGIKISDIETCGFGNYVEVYKLEVIGNIHDNKDLLKEE